MRLAIIGLGHIGLRRARLLREMGHFVAGMDTDPVKHDAGLIEGFSYHADRYDAVFICTPPESHAAVGIVAANAGAEALFVEKPLSDTMRDALALCGAAAAIPVTMVACNWRFRAGVGDLLLRPGMLRVEANVPIPAERRTEKCWDIDWHFVDLALQSGRPGYDIASSYDGPYSVTMERGGKMLRWGADYDADEDYRAEMAHFLDCVERGVPTCNPLGPAMETLRMLLEAKDADSTSQGASCRNCLRIELGSGMLP